MEAILKKHPVIAILRGIPMEQTLHYADAAWEGGIRAFEVTSNSPDAAAQIKLLRQHFGGIAAIGAGTAITLERAKEACQAGAEFLLTPSVNLPVIAYCLENHVPILPGVMTPTDVDVCYNLGIRIMKLFPAGDLPIKYIKSLQGPFDDTRYVAVGGVTPENLPEFQKAGFIGAGMGSNLIPAALREKDKWKEAADRIRRMLESCPGWSGQ